jgi:hypothetical protein
MQSYSEEKKNIPHDPKPISIGNLLPHRRKGGRVPVPEAASRYKAKAIFSSTNRLFISIQAWIRFYYSGVRKQGLIPQVGRIFAQSVRKIRAKFGKNAPRSCKNPGRFDQNLKELMHFLGA